MRRYGSLLLMFGCSSQTPSAPPDTQPAPPLPDAAAPDSSMSGAAPRPVGTVTNVSYQTSCSVPNAIGATQPGFRCATLTVSCPGTDDTQVEVALAPATGTSKGVVVTHSGSNGTTFQNGGGLPQAWLGRGWSLAQIAWLAPWECPKHAGTSCASDPTPLAQRAGMVESGCRPATVMQWIHDSAQLSDGTPFVAPGKPYCGHGASGGSGAFWYALMHYGMSSRLDFVLLGASSPMGRIDIGCDPQYAQTTAPGPCDNIAPPQVWVYDDANGAGASKAFNTWLSTTGCDAAPTNDEMALYARSSVLAPGADTSFITPVTTYDCIDAATLNVVPGGGHFVHDALRANDPSSAKWKGMCVVTGAGGNGTCTGEQVFGDPAMAQAAIAELDTRCQLLQR